MSAQHHDDHHARSSEDWFQQGTRVLFDPLAKKIVKKGNENTVSVFERVVAPVKPCVNTRWLTMLPALAEGSYGYAQVDDLLQVAPRLYVDYVGQGDSDKPKKYEYSTMERADLIEAQWKAHKVRRTVLVSVANSSLVMMELLHRQCQRLSLGLPLRTRIEHVLAINGGYFADGHTPHPLHRSSLKRTTLGKVTAHAAQHSDLIMGQILRKWFTKDYQVTAEELGELEKVIRRHNGVFFLAELGAYLEEHQKYSQRWDLRSIYAATRRRQGVSFTLVGSDEDPYERRQMDLAKERLGMHPDVATVSIPGGYKVTSEQSHRIADMIDALALAPVYDDESLSDSFGYKTSSSSGSYSSSSVTIHSGETVSSGDSTSDMSDFDFPF